MTFLSTVNCILLGSGKSETVMVLCIDRLSANSGSTLLKLHGSTNWLAILFNGIDNADSFNFGTAL